MTTPDTSLAAYRLYARGLAAALRGEGSPTSAGYAALTADNELQPWTEAALTHWSTGEGPWHVHHLAIAHHARAYDLEAAGESKTAAQHWRKALEHWAALHRDDRFWDGLREHLETVSGAPLPDGLLDGVRARLPEYLLAPHVTLATRYRLTDPDRARRHAECIRLSTLPEAAVTRARDQFGADTVAGLGQAIKEARFTDTIRALLSWFAIDPTSTRLARALLLVTRRWCEGQSRAPEWTVTVGPTLARVHAALTSLDLPATHGIAADLRPELARHYYWLGLEALRRGVSKPDLALGYFRRGLLLDPDLTESLEYQHTRRLLARAAIDQIGQRLADEGGANLNPRPTARGGQLAVMAEVGDTVLDELHFTEQFTVLVWSLNIADPPVGELAAARRRWRVLRAHPEAPPDMRLFFLQLDALLAARGC
ncbi:hypothetical protein [Pseudofrankia asymbiotica]|uniref:Uncharacterized protein n=1 Tax=Pseudofrankia asymbiotica TaxID=1834516 RepID=A0A1V2IE15_9ACTN|nr:hypothetical protein [Pseudofrankia asymbiotica]ONH31433.1 hypothetical protein BL253_09335 [Pseudofrankia asymbiotica]